MSRLPQVRCTVIGRAEDLSRTALNGFATMSFLGLLLAGLLAPSLTLADAFDDCRNDKLKTAGSFYRQLSRCYAAHARKPSTASLSACSDRALLRLHDSFAKAELTASLAGAACPATAADFRLEGEEEWVQSNVNAQLLAVNDLPSPCVRNKIKLLFNLTKRRQSCLLHELAKPGTGRLSRCQLRSRTRFGQRWARANRKGLCESATASATEKHIDENLDAQIALFETVCGDGTVTAFEQCDDGGTAVGDGCDGECREEQCATVSGELRCIYCPGGTPAAPDYLGCACAAGFEPDLGGDCVDIDECALGIDDCDPGACVNSPGDYSCAVACTQAALEAAIADCGGASGRITFDCSDTVILLDDADGWAARQLFCDDVIIDGLDRNITFELDPPCFEGFPPGSCAPEDLNNDGTCDCPEYENGTGFVVLEGNNNTVRNLSLRYFSEGIHAAGANNTVENVNFTRHCDDALTNQESAVGTVFSNIEILDGCDKCAQVAGDISLTSADPESRDYWNATLDDVRFVGCEKPLRAAQGGRFLLNGCQMVGPGSARFHCVGPLLSTGVGDQQVVHIVDTLIDNCTRGLRVGGEVELVVRDSVIRNTRFFGLRASKNAVVSMQGNQVVDNGGRKSTSEPGSGGVVVLADAELDLGGGALTIDGQLVSSTGGNTVCRNKAPPRIAREVDASLLNDPAQVVKAENNTWCSDSPASRVLGNVDLDPVAPTP